MSGGEIVEQACHHMDVMNWVMENQHPLYCVSMGSTMSPKAKESPHKHVTEDHSAAIFEFPGGVKFSYTHLFYCPKQFTGEQLRVYGHKKGIDLRMGQFFDESNQDAKLDESQPNWDAGTVEELESFVNDVCRNGKRALSNEDYGSRFHLHVIDGQKSHVRKKHKRIHSACGRLGGYGFQFGIE